jgi:hypothetical protein
MAILMLGLVGNAYKTTANRQLDLSNRVWTLAQTQVGLERMTRELRDANWVYVRSSQVIDAETMVRPAGGGTAVAKLVRFDCTNVGCVRSEGPDVTFPPPAAPTFTSTRTVIGSATAADLMGQVRGQDVFWPTRIDPTTGLAKPNYLDPDTIGIRLRVLVQGHTQPIELRDGVAVRDRGAFS